MPQDMAPTDAAFGFIPWGPVLRQRLYVVNTNPTIGIYNGDPMENGGGFVSTPHGYMLDVIDDAGIANSDDDILGMVTSIFDENMDPMIYMAAARVGAGSIAGYVMVADHPDQLFVGQEDSTTNAIDLDDAGDNANIVYAAGSSTTGRSGCEIASDTIANTISLHLQIHYPHPDDTPAEDTYWCRYIVSINTHAWAHGDGRTGI